MQTNQVADPDQASLIQGAHVYFFCLNNTGSLKRSLGTTKQRLPFVDQESTFLLVKLCDLSGNQEALRIIISKLIYAETIRLFFSKIISASFQHCWELNVLLSCRSRKFGRGRSQKILEARFRSTSRTFYLRLNNQGGNGIVFIYF